MAWWMPLIMGASALAGAFAPKQKQESNSFQETHSDNNSTASSMPMFDLPTLGARDFALQSMVNSVQGMSDFSREYSASGLSNINKGADVKKRIINNLLASRGLSGTTAGTSAVADLEGSRINESANFLNSVPLQMEQMRSDRVNDLSRFVSSLPVGNTVQQSSTQHSQQRGTGTGTQSGQGGFPGAFGNAAETLAYFYGQQRNRGTQSKPVNT